MIIDKDLMQLQNSIDNFKKSVEEYLALIRQKEGENMPYKITIKDQQTNKETKREIETLKELKLLLLEYKDMLINIEMKETSKKR